MQVFHIEATGEVFRSYETFLQKKDLYGQVGAGRPGLPSPGMQPPARRQASGPTSCCPCAPFREESTILCQFMSSMQTVWACRYSGKGGMTFEEAQEAEKKAVAALASVRALLGLLLPAWACNGSSTGYNQQHFVQSSRTALDRSCGQRELPARTIFLCSSACSDRRCCLDPAWLLPAAVSC